MYTYMAKVKRWVDGDTVDMEVDLGFHIATHCRFRVLNLDTPERGSENYKEATELAKSVHPEGSTVEIQTHKTDLYGRWLVSLPLLVTAMNEHGYNRLYKV